MADVLDVSSEKVSPLTKKLSKILENNLENDKGTLEAMKELSTFFTENSIRTRRNLRGDIEARNLATNQELFNAFNEIKVALDGVYVEISSMNQSCKEMASKLNSTKTRTQQLLTQMSSLQSSNKNLVMEQEIASRVIEQFQLTPADLAQLRGSEQPITEEYFSALEKAQKIHLNCKQLLQKEHQTTVFEVMEQMALYQEAALEKLYRWTQAQCRNVESPEASLLLPQAVACLQDRPVLLKYVVDEYCTARRAIVVRSFLDALTVGGPYGTPRPMELHAHDPPRYVGDMLAWLHQMTPTEKENIQVLLKGCHKLDVSEYVTGALSNITEGVCRPLRVRLEQVISSEVGASVLHTLSGLIRFYLNTIGEVIPSSSLMETLSEVYAQCQRTFLITLESNVSRLLERIQPPTQDLSPSLGVSQILNLLRDVLSGGHIVDAKPSDVADVVNRIVDPLLESIIETAARLPSIDQAAYILNCVYQIHSSLSLYEYVDDRLQSLEALMNNQLAHLSSEQTTSLIHSLGLTSVCTLLQSRGKGEVLSSVPGMDSSSLHSFLVKFDALLSAPDALQLPQCRLLISGVHRKLISKNALETIIAIYCQLYESVHDPTNGYLNPNSIMPHTPDQIRGLLD